MLQRSLRHGVEIFDLELLFGVLHVAGGSKKN